MAFIFIAYAEIHFIDVENLMLFLSSSLKYFPVKFRIKLLLSLLFN